MFSFIQKRERVLITEKHNDDENPIGRHKGKDIITSKKLENRNPHLTHKRTMKEQQKCLVLQCLLRKLHILQGTHPVEF